MKTLQPTIRRIDVKELTGLDTLIGKTDGQRCMPKFVSIALNNMNEETLLWDWTGVQIATASFFAATLIPLLKMTISGELKKYFVLTRMNKNCLDELILVLEAEELVVMLAEMKGESIRSVELIGHINRVYADTFTEVINRKRASAAELFRDSKNTSKSRVGKTAWVNRLTDLNRLRLLKKEKVGREFVFQAPFLEG